MALKVLAQTIDEKIWARGCAVDVSADYGYLSSAPLSSIKIVNSLHVERLGEGIRIV